MKKVIYVFIFLIISNSQSFAIQKSLPKGAGLLLHVQVNDIDRYIDELTKNSGVLFTSGAAAAGYCIVKTGHNYPGEVTIWQLFKSMGELMKAVDENDPMNKPALNFSKMRDIKYISIWKDMKRVNLKPGFEMVERWNIPPENLSDFVSAVRDIESNSKEMSGFDFVPQEPQGHTGIYVGGRYPTNPKPCLRRARHGGRARLGCGGARR